MRCDATRCDAMRCDATRTSSLQRREIHMLTPRTQAGSALSSRQRWEEGLDCSRTAVGDLGQIWLREGAKLTDASVAFSFLFFSSLPFSSTHLTTTDHAFCLKCIKKWRASAAAREEQAGEEQRASHEAKENARACPLCRTLSDFVVPRCVGASRRVKCGARESIILTTNRRCRHHPPTPSTTAARKTTAPSCPSRQRERQRSCKSTDRGWEGYHASCLGVGGERAHLVSRGGRDSRAVWCSVLCCAVLCCAVLCCAVMSCHVMWSPLGCSALAPFAPPSPPLSSLNSHLHRSNVPLQPRGRSRSSRECSRHRHRRRRRSRRRQQQQ